MEINTEKICTCDHPVENAVKYQKYSENEDGAVILICTNCGRLWDHRVTDRIITAVMAGKFLTK